MPSQLESSKTIGLVGEDFSGLTRTVARPRSARVFQFVSTCTRTTLVSSVSAASRTRR